MRRNYIRNLKSYPIETAITSKNSLIKWIISMKNLISKDNGVPDSRLDTFNGIRRKYLGKNYKKVITNLL
jgi:hypothetical protein